MKSFIFLLLTASLLTTGCESTRDSKANPFNWFGGSKKEGNQSDAKTALIPKKKLTLFTMKKTEAVYLGQPIDKLSTLIMDEVPGGLLIQVTGMAQKTGIYDGRLIPLDSPDTSVLEFRFDVIQPTDATGGPIASRTITVAAYLTDQDLETVSTIRVRGANNTLTKRR